VRAFHGAQPTLVLRVKRCAFIWRRSQRSKATET